MNTRELAKRLGIYSSVKQNDVDFEKPSTMDYIHSSLSKFRRSLSTHSLTDWAPFELGPVWTPAYKSQYEGSFSKHENLYQEAISVLQSLDVAQKINEAEINAESFLDFIDQARPSNDRAIVEALENNESFLNAFYKFQKALINLLETNNFFKQPFHPQHVPAEKYKPLKLLHDNYEKETGRLLEKFKTHLQFIEKILTSYKVHTENSKFELEKDGMKSQLSLKR